MDNKSINLGGNIELTGFRDIDSSTMAILKKRLDNYSKRIGELTKKLDMIHITLKPVHEREKSEKYELHAKIIDGGKVYTSEVTERNLFVAFDAVLKKIVNELD